MPPIERTHQGRPRRSQKEATIEKLTDSTVSVEGQATRPVT